MMPQPPQNDRFLKALAEAYVKQPRATLKQLAEAAGTSKATLHRLCGTRDGLVQMLTDASLSAVNQVIEEADLPGADPLVAFRRLIEGHLAQRELLVFMMFQYRPASHSPESERERWVPYAEALDAFYLRGQHEGVFRIDISAQMLTELFVSTLCGIVEAERCGRAASATSATLFEQFFLNGSAAPVSPTANGSTTP
jgi:TetR/AcrR family transcriptional regulator, mexCD-oprJ operon repressor